MTLVFTVALASAAAANGCTFCYATSKFESDCKDRGGEVRTFAASQTCVLERTTSAQHALDDDDAGD